MCRISEALILQILAQRSPDQLIEYYTERLVYSPTVSLNWFLDTHSKTKKFTSDYTSGDPQKDYAYRLQDEGVIEGTRDYVKYIVDNLNLAGLGKYIEWVIYKAQDQRMPEDLEKITQDLKIYDQLKRVPNINLQRDINQYNMFNQLAMDLDPYRDQVQNELLRMNPEYVQKHEQTGGVQTVLQEGPFTVYSLTDANASADLCRHTSWCVKDPQHFEHYNISASNPLYLISKDGVKYALAHFGSGQLKDPQDRPIQNEEKIKELYPIIKKINPTLVKDVLKLEGSDFDVLFRLPESKKEAEGVLQPQLDEYIGQMFKLENDFYQHYKVPIELASSEKTHDFDMDKRDIAQKTGGTQLLRNLALHFGRNEEIESMINNLKQKYKSTLPGSREWIRNVASVYYNNAKWHHQKKEERLQRIIDDPVSEEEERNAIEQIRYHKQKVRELDDLRTWLYSNSGASYLTPKE